MIPLGPEETSWDEREVLLLKYVKENVRTWTSINQKNLYKILHWSIPPKTLNKFHEKYSDDVEWKPTVGGKMIRAKDESSSA